MNGHYASPQLWADGADPAYDAMSRAIVAASPVPLTGRTVLDLGAGTGATSRAISAAGAHPIEIDLSHPMLAFRRESRAPAVVADITALPVRTDSVDGTVAAFSLSHVERPGDVLRESCRVSRPESPVVAGVFAANGPRHEASSLVEDVAKRCGWTAPVWYLRLKNELEPAVAEASSLLHLATAAGLTRSTVFDVDVDAGLRTAQALVAWRLAGPALAGWVKTLARADRDALVRAAEREVGGDPQPLRVTVRILASIVPAAR